MPIRAGRSSFRNLLVVAIGLIGTATLAIGMTIWWLRSNTTRDASEEVGNLAIVLAEQTTRSIQSIHLILNEIQQRIETLGVRAPNDINRVLRDEDTHQLLIERLSHLQQAEFIRLVDRNGKLVSATDKWPWSEVDVSHTAHFQHFKNNDDKGLYINDFQVDPVKGTHVVFFSKRINGAYNTFLGVVVVGVRLTYFQHIYESIASLHDRSFVLLHRDGTVIVRYPDSKDRVGEKMPTESPWYRLVSQGGGRYRSPGIFDGIARLVAVRPLSEYPLVIDVTISENSALASWRNHTIYIGFGALLILLCSAFLLKALSRQFNRLSGSEASLAESKAILVKKAHDLESANTQLSNSQAQTNAALNNMVQGLLMFDSSSRLVVCNQRFIEMYGLSPEIIRPGCTVREIVEHRAATGSFHTDDIEQYVADIHAAHSQGTIFSKITSLNDGRIISIVNHPIADGGWVATHEDVTDQKACRAAHYICSTL
jgi:PAS domain-containing protein